MESHKHKKLKVLFVDDDLINIETFVVSFQDEYKILTASSGEQALEIYRNEQDIALVISDQRMPGMTGVELLTLIYDLNPESVRIIITGYMDVSDILDSINKGHIYQYVLKPWDIVQLRLVLDQASQSWTLVRENRLLNEKLSEKNKQLEKANQDLKISEKRLRHLSSVLITVLEDERKRIAMELHDELGQSLAAVKLHLRLCENKFVEKPPTPREVHDQMEELRQFLNEIIENVRRLSKDLSPVIIDDLGLDAAIENLIGNFSRYNDIECDASMEPIATFFAPDAQRLIYRLIQETLNNVRRHSGATKVKLDLDVQKKYVTIQVADNGKGFDYEAIMNKPACHRGIGLSAMTERANMLDGFVDVKSAEGEGTSVLFTIPIPQSNMMEE